MLISPPTPSAVDPTTVDPTTVAHPTQRPGFTPSLGQKSLGQDRGTRARREFYEAVWSELRDKGYAGLNVSGVVNRAGASRGRFYHHFKNLEEALLRAYRHHSDVSFRRIEQAVQRGQPVEEAFVAELRESIPNSERQYLAEIELMLVSMRNERVHNLFVEDFQARLRQTSALIQTGMDRGELVPRQSARAIAEQLFAGSYGIYLLHFARRTHDGLEAQLSAHIRLVFASVRTAAS